MAPGSVRGSCTGAGAVADRTWPIAVSRRAQSPRYASPLAAAARSLCERLVLQQRVLLQRLTRRVGLYSETLALLLRPVVAAVAGRLQHQAREVVEAVAQAVPVRVRGGPVALRRLRLQLQLVVLQRVGVPGHAGGAARPAGTPGGRQRILVGQQGLRHPPTQGVAREQLERSI